MGRGMKARAAAFLLALALLLGGAGGDDEGQTLSTEGRNSVAVLVTAMESDVHHLDWLIDCLSSRLPATRTRVTFHISTVGQPAQGIEMNERHRHRKPCLCLHCCISLPTALLPVDPDSAVILD